MLAFKKFIFNWEDYCDSNAFIAAASLLTYLFYVFQFLKFFLEN